MTPRRCDSCAQGAVGTWTVSWLGVCSEGGGYLFSRPKCPPSNSISVELLWGLSQGLLVRAPGLCWVGTASGPFLENNFHPLEVGLTFGFCQSPLHSVQKWEINGFLGAKVGENGQNHFLPTLEPFRTLTKNRMLDPLQRGGGNLSLQRT